MRKKNGFMMYELVISFALAFAILLIIFNTTITLSQRLTSLYVKNKVSSRQVVLNKKIGKDFADYQLTKIAKDVTTSGCAATNPNIQCYKFFYTGGGTKTLKVSTEPKNQYIEYNNEKTKYSDNDEEDEIIIYPMENPSIISITGTGNTHYYFVKIKIPIKFLDDDKDYGIELYHLYKGNASGVTFEGF